MQVYWRWVCNCVTERRLIRTLLLISLLLASSSAYPPLVSTPSVTNTLPWWRPVQESCISGVVKNWLVFQPKSITKTLEHNICLFLLIFLSFPLPSFLSFATLTIGWFVVVPSFIIRLTVGKSGRGQDMPEDFVRQTNNNNWVAKLEEGEREGKKEQRTNQLQVSKYTRVLLCIYSSPRTDVPPP